LTSSTADELVGLGVATLHEAAGRRYLLRGLELLVGDPFAGPAVTVALPAGDNLGIHLAIEASGAGSVVCVGSAGGGTYGVFGDLLFEAARARGVAGLVLDDGIRDIAELIAPPGIAARGVAAQGTIKARLRQPVGSEIALGGQLVAQGDWVVCDRDGICALPADEVDTIVEAGKLRVQKEDGVRTAIRAGRTTRDLLGLPASARASLP
jgi:4-hydroxy-4-methyl-2-oxoglutarate aldolase